MPQRGVDDIGAFVEGRLGHHGGIRLRASLHQGRRSGDLSARPHPSRSGHVCRRRGRGRWGSVGGVRFGVGGRGRGGRGAPGVAHPGVKLHVGAERLVQRAQLRGAERQEHVLGRRRPVGATLLDPTQQRLLTATQLRTRQTRLSAWERKHSKLKHKHESKRFSLRSSTST